MGDAVQELGDPLRRLGLQQIAGRAAADGGEQVLVGAGGGEHDDLAARRCGSNLRQRLEPVHAGHRQVEKNEVGLEVAGALDRLGAVAGLADDGEPVLLEQPDERRPRERVVVDDERATSHPPQPCS